MVRIAAPVRALLTHLIDYAGLYPPAALPLEIVAERYRCFLASPDGWILNRLVLPQARLASTLQAAPAADNWRITLLVDQEPGPMPSQVETFETKLATRLSLPTYCEAPLDRLHDVWAKVRTGGLTPDAIPDSEGLADFLLAAAARKLPFKATAGLHHAVRAVRALTYAPDSPRAPMHGFLNVFTAAAFAWHGAQRGPIVELLEEEDAAAFVFSEKALEWRGRKLTPEQIAAARRDFAHSFGSCSFEEPISDLRDLELLP